MPAGGRTSYEEQIRTGVLIGSGIGGIEGIADNAIVLHEKGPRRISPFFIPGRIINLASGYVSIEFGLKGPNHAVVTACSTGAHAIGDAARMMALGDADVMVAGGTESPVNRIAHRRLCGLARAVHRVQRRAQARLAPLRQGPRRLRDGRGRRRRGARRARARQGARRQDLCRADRLRAVGRRLSHHRAVAGRRRRVPLHEHGDQARRHFRRRDRLHQRARHLDAARRRDRARRGAARSSATPPAASRCPRPNPAIGHLLGAAGAVEAIFSILAIRDRVAPPTINLDNPSVETPIDLVPHVARKRDIDIALVELVRLRRHQCLADLHAAIPASAVPLPKLSP